MAHFSQTGSRNMAETRAINFLTLVSYSTSIVIFGLWRLLPFLIRARPDLVNFAQNRQSAVFMYKEESLSTPPFRVEHRSVIKI